MRIRFLARLSMEVKGTNQTCECQCVFACSSFWFIIVVSLSAVGPFIMLMLLSFNCRKIAPTILLDVPRDSVIMNEEIFGPLLPIVTVGTKRVDYIDMAQAPLFL